MLCFPAHVFFFAKESVVICCCKIMIQVRFMAMALESMTHCGFQNSAKTKKATEKKSRLMAKCSLKKIRDNKVRSVLVWKSFCRAKRLPELLCLRTCQNTMLSAIKRPTPAKRLSTTL